MVGKLLIAHPSLLGDPSFGRSVILMAEHNNEGSLGFVVNQPTHYNLNELIPSRSRQQLISQGALIIPKVRYIF